MYKGGVLLSSGYFTVWTPSRLTADLVAFGRNFIANPDLFKRLEQVDHHKFIRTSRDIFKAAEGYTGNPFALLL